MQATRTASHRAAETIEAYVYGLTLASLLLGALLGAGIVAGLRR